MNAERCQRCFGEVLQGKCSCGLHTTEEPFLWHRKWVSKEDLLHYLPDSSSPQQKDDANLEQSYIDAAQDPEQLEITKDWDSTCGDGIEKQACSICDDTIKNLKRGQAYPVCDYHYYVQNATVTFKRMEPLPPATKENIEEFKKFSIEYFKKYPIPEKDDNGNTTSNA